MTPNKFRAKVIDTNEWIYGALIIRPEDAYLSKGVCGIMRVDDSGSLLYTHVSLATVGLWTGRQDAYGTEIYQGDKLLVEGVLEVVVVWDDQTAGFNSTPYISYADRGWDETMTDHSMSVEVIGSIHDANQKTT